MFYKIQFNEQIQYRGESIPHVAYAIKDAHDHFVPALIDAITGDFAGVVKITNLITAEVRYYKIKAGSDCGFSADQLDAIKDNKQIHHFDTLLGEGWYGRFTVDDHLYSLNAVDSENGFSVYVSSLHPYGDGYLGTGLCSFENMTTISTAFQSVLSFLKSDRVVLHPCTFEAEWLMEAGGVACEFDGFTDGRVWNGWACPYFTYDQAMAYVTAVRVSIQLLDSAGNTTPLPYYDQEHDRFVFIMEDDPDDPRYYSAELINGVKYYPIGYGEWTWTKVND